MNGIFNRFIQDVTLHIVSLATLLVCMSFLSVSQLSAQDNKHQPYRIVATIGMVSDLVTQIAGNRAKVESLINPGVDPHLHKPTRNDIKALLQADVVFYAGLNLEGKMADVLVRAATSGRKVYPVTAAIPADSLLSPEEFEGYEDPHVWGDPQAWAKTVGFIADKLSEFDPMGADVYSSNAQVTLEAILAIDTYAEQVLHSIPKKSRVLITAHDAFNYFAQRYGFEVMAIQGISTESEAGVQDIERLVSTLVERKIHAVFVESTVSQRNIQALIQGAAARGHSVTVGGELFSDAMGAADTYEGTYVGMVDHNATTIARALGGEAPQSGANGQLGKH